MWCVDRTWPEHFDSVCIVHDRERTSHRNDSLCIQADSNATHERNSPARGISHCAIDQEADHMIDVVQASDVQNETVPRDVMAAAEQNHGPAQPRP